MYNLTSNEFYGGINRRFDKRIALLVKFGYRRESVHNIALYVRPRWNGKVDAIPACFISFAPKRAWLDELAMQLKRG